MAFRPILVKLDESNSGGITRDGRKVALVWATSIFVARALLNSMWESDNWTDSTTQFQSVDGASNFDGYQFRIRVSGAPGEKDLVEVIYTPSASDNIDDIGTGLAALLAAKGLTASYESVSNDITVAAGSDGYGDRTIQGANKLPNAETWIIDYDTFWSVRQHNGQTSDDLKIRLPSLVANTNIPKIVY